MTTDGKKGVLSADDIVSNHLIAVIGNDLSVFFLFEKNTTVSVTGNDLTAFSKYLMFDFGTDDGGIFSLTGTEPHGVWCNGAGGQSSCSQGITLSGGIPPMQSTAPLITDTIIASTPELSTWAMMAIGFAALGFAGYRKAKRPFAA